MESKFMVRCKSILDQMDEAERRRVELQDSFEHPKWTMCLHLSALGETRVSFSVWEDGKFSTHNNARFSLTKDGRPEVESAGAYWQEIPEIRQALDEWLKNVK